jgi:hypothetical protein
MFPISCPTLSCYLTRKQKDIGSSITRKIQLAFYLTCQDKSVKYPMASIFRRSPSPGTSENTNKKLVLPDVTNTQYIKITNSNKLKKNFKQLLLIATQEIHTLYILIYVTKNPRDNLFEPGFFWWSEGGFCCVTLVCPMLYLF